MNNLDEFFKENGFESQEEFQNIAAKIDICRIQQYLEWVKNDRTKEGLLKLISTNV